MRKKMDETTRNQIEKYFEYEISRLNFKSLVIKSACKKFELSPEEALLIYKDVR